MSRSFRLYSTAEAAGGADFSGCAALVFDVLRATTTLTFAFENGAAEAFAASDVPGALRLADELSHAGVLLCGEREGRKIPGFDLGNSPSEYTSARVAGRPLVFASTNGSRALLAARFASRSAIASLVNAPAAARWLQSGEEPVALVCSGKEGVESEEDLIGAGAVLEYFGSAVASLELDAGSVLAREMFRRTALDLSAALRATPHGAYLAGIGFADDVAGAAELGRLLRVPEWREGRLLPGCLWPVIG